MFCPRCASAMLDRDGELTCLAGDMGLSRDMRERLSRACAEPRRALELSAAPSPGWFCPRCAAALSSIPGEHLAKACPSCGVTLDGATIHALIELHPHCRP